MTIKVYADELLRLTLDDIGDEEFFEIKDPENQTDEHLAHLRELCDERAQKVQSRAVGADELEHRLSQLPSSELVSARCYRSLSTSTIDTEKDKEEAWEEEVEAYRALVAEGGRPSHPVTLGYDVLSNPGEYEDIIWFWHGVGGYYSVFHRQLIEWREFRKIQDRKRRHYIPRNRFQEYEILIRESQADAGCELDLRVLEDRYQQNRLEDWNEFRAFYYRRLKAYEKLVPPAEQNLRAREKQLEDARARLTDVITDRSVLSGRFDDIRASQKAVAQAKSRLESAEKALQAMERRGPKRKLVLAKMAQQELHSAKDNLMRLAGSEEMRRLRDGHELHNAQEVMLTAKGKLARAEYDVKRWRVFLNWIDDQYLAIAAECGCFDNPTNEFSLRLAGEREDSKGQEEWRQLRKKRRAQTRSVLRPNTSRVSKALNSKSSKIPKSTVALSSVRATIAAQFSLAARLQEDQSRALATASAQQGDDDRGNDSQQRPSQANWTLEPIRRSARIAKRAKGLQESKSPRVNVEDIGKDVQELLKVKRLGRNTLKRAATKSDGRLNDKRLSKAQGVSKRRSLPR